MKPAEINLAIALSKCRMLPGSWDKRFIRDIAGLAQNTPEAELTDKQLEWLDKMGWKYRRQLSAEELQLWRSVHGGRLLKQLDEIIGPKPESGSVVLGGQGKLGPHPKPTDAVLGSAHRLPL